MNTEFLIPIAFFAAIIMIVYLFLRKKERMALMVFLCGGIALVIYHFIARNLQKKKPPDA